MYGGKGGGGGAASITGGAIILPNTGGHIILTIVALTSITIGAAILLSIFGRWVAKKAYTQA
jgi:hypothetical protein